MTTVVASFRTDSDRVRMRNEIRKQIVGKLSDKEYRDIFVSEQINTGLAFQIRAMREQRGWTQSKLGKEARMAQSRISIMEDANYSRFNLNTLKRVASAFDVALVVRFEPFSKLVDNFVNLDSSSLKVASFKDDTFSAETSQPQTLTALNLGVGTVAGDFRATEVAWAYNMYETPPEWESIRVNLMLSQSFFGTATSFRVYSDVKVNVPLPAMVA